MFLRLLLLSSITIIGLSYAATKEDNTPEGRLLAGCMVSDESPAQLGGILREIEANGANINIKDDASGQTPLMASVLRGRTTTVRLLLGKDADFTIGEKDGYTPAHGAGFQGRAEIMQVLHEHGVNVIDDFHTDGYAPLHRACWGREQRHTDTIAYLVEKVGVDPELKSKDGKICAGMTRNEATRAFLQKYAETLANSKDEL
mmetsp:Transcript_13077/g.19281  ORF Transcript_13077/g.19281 Transcript_13077/m.19281 type:complete len:202 (-) Transcript_13077:23-628(-)